MEFNDYWFLAGNDGAFGTLQVLKPFYNLDGLDMIFRTVGKQT